MVTRRFAAITVLVALLILVGGFVGMGAWASYGCDQGCNRGSPAFCSTVNDGTCPSGQLCEWDECNDRTGWCGYSCFKFCVGKSYECLHSSCNYDPVCCGSPC